jgi:hypothetical protein
MSTAAWPAKVDQAIARCNLDKQQASRPLRLPWHAAEARSERPFRPLPAIYDASSTEAETDGRRGRRTFSSSC